MFSGGEFRSMCGDYRSGGECSSTRQSIDAVFLLVACSWPGMEEAKWLLKRLSWSYSCLLPSDDLSGLVEAFCCVKAYLACEPSLWESLKVSFPGVF